MCQVLYFEHALFLLYVFHNRLWQGKQKKKKNVHTYLLSYIVHYNATYKYDEMSCKLRDVTWHLWLTRFLLDIYLITTYSNWFTFDIHTFLVEVSRTLLREECGILMLYKYRIMLCGRSDDIFSLIVTFVVINLIVCSLFIYTWSISTVFVHQCLSSMAQ